MTFCYSEPLETLIERPKRPAPVLAQVRVLIVGSGYGGAIAAYRLSGRRSDGGPPRDVEVMVLERGREYALGEFPNALGELPGHVRVQRSDRPDGDGNADALFDFHLGENVDVLVGSGLGGTSLINANVAMRPSAATFSTRPWPTALQNEATGATRNRLQTAFDEVEKLLGVASPEDRKQLTSLPKYKAFAHFAAALGCSVETAPITVTLPGPSASRPNAAGIVQEPCTSCGNCVTGCNVGAKNTLAMNAIPAAWRRGAKFYTGAEVIRVGLSAASAATGPRWSVYVRPTDRAARARCEQPFIIEADTVILSAGTLGSTLILKRSEQANKSLFSPLLGERFSTNGDGIAMSFAERDRVGAMGASAYQDKGACGPTITAVARGQAGKTGSSEPFTLEEGAVPASIVMPFGELLTTSAQLHRVGRNKLPAWLDGNRKFDPLASHSEARERSQVFLWMSRDGTGSSETDPKGSLYLETDGAGPDGGIIVPKWKPGKDGPSAPFECIDRHLAKHDRKKGLHSGQYVPNPLWRFMPQSASSAMSGRFPGGRLITVHPLGGCVMGDSGSDGVVDANGQVFKGSTAETFPGLHVLDGSIVPAALGVNPFLTIAALSWRACDTIAQELQLVETNAPLLKLPIAPVLPPRIESSIGPVIVSERLAGMLDDPDKPEPKKRLLKIFPNAQRWFETDGLILDIATFAEDTPALLDGSQAVRLTAKLYRNRVKADIVKRSQMYGAPDAHITPEDLIAEGEGTITLMTPNYPPSGTGWIRTLEAFFAYLKRRQSLKDLLSDQAKKKTESRDSFWSALAAMKNVAEMHATYREFVYDLRLTPLGEASRHLITIKGKKRLAWRVGNPRVWQALLELPVRFEVKNARFKTAARLIVDMRYLLGTGLVRVDSGGNVPLGTFNAVAFITRLARSILQSSFWEFGAPAYPDEPLAPQPHLPAQLRDGTPRVGPLPFDVPRKIVDSEPTSLRLHLHRYGENGKPPVLLVHGLAQGSRIYADPALQPSMADYFNERGFDVWLLDYRLSNQFDEGQIAHEGWSMEEIGELDIPYAVKEVLKHYESGTRLHVFAHCVGAVGIAVAILSGRLGSAQLASVVLNAIHPWTMPSPANTARAKLAAFYRDYIGNDVLDPIIQTKSRVSAMQSLLDRLAFSLARLGEGERDHRLEDDENLQNAICDRMTFTYGRMWRHENVKRIHGHWKDLVGRSPVEVQRHLYYMLIDQRVLDRSGVNSYLLDENIVNWRGIRTLFMHGDRSSVFNPQSATRSAIRLQRVLNRVSSGDPVDSPVPGTPIGLKRVKDYGHMDVILADDAQKKSFPYIEHFLKGEFDVQRSVELPSGGTIELDEIVPAHDVHSGARLTTTAGPVLRAARIEQHKLILRYWFELPTMNTSPTAAVRLSGMEHTRLVVSGVADHYWWVEAEIDPATYRIPTVTVQPGGSDTGIPVGSLGEKLESLLRSYQPPLATDAGSFWRSKDIDALPAWLRRLIQRTYGSPKDDCYFLVASCRYTGMPFDQSSADDVFAGMHCLLNTQIPCDLLFLIGDQIYADATAGLLDPVPWHDRYTLRYRQAFTGESMRKVLQWLPCHFAVDDHEFADNFLGVAPSGPKFVKYRAWHVNQPARAIASGDIDRDQWLFAMEIARSYMDSGRVQNPFGAASPPLAAISPEPDPLWYELDDRAEIRCPAFVLDTRSERQRPHDGRPATMISRRQMDALKSWLQRRASDDRPKFIFAGSVIVPLSPDADRPGMWIREDGFRGYPNELEEIVAHIVDLGIERVVFVGGDLHLSCAAEMLLSKGKSSVRALQIVSSGLYAPLPFANVDTRTIEWESPTAIELGSSRIDYKPFRLADGESHFMRVAAEATASGSWSITIESYNVQGNLIARRSHPL